MNYKLINYIKKNIKYLLIVMILIVIVTYCDLILPDYMAKIIDIGIKNKDINYIYRISKYMIVFTTIGFITNIIIGYISSILSNKITHDIRYDLYSKIIKMENSRTNISSSSLVNRLTTDINQVNSGLFMILRIVIMAPIIAIFAIIKVLTTNTKMSIVLFISILIMFITIILLFKKVYPKINKSKKLLDRINLISHENVIGIKTIKAFNKQEYQISKFDKTNKEILNINNYINKIMLLLTPLVTFIINITTIIIIYIGSKEILYGNFKVGLMIAYIEYMLQVLSAFLMVSLLFVIIPKMSVSNKRIKEVMLINNDIEDIGKQKLNKNITSIELKNVSFSYRNNNTFIKNINLKINYKEKVGIIGSFASGKTTLINLLTRIYDIDSGTILINNKDYKNYSLNSLRKNISVSQQENIIYNGTIKSNIIYSNKNIKNSKLKQIFKISKLNTLVSFKDINKYKINNDGNNLSGGEKCRINIARTLAKDSQIYIFDDSTSAIDYKNSNEIINDIIKYLEDKIVIIISQKISNIKNLDKIIVMDNGTISNIGNHEYLLANSKIYKQIYDSQNIYGE